MHFPDGMVLQGCFGAMETVADLYDFVFENMFDKELEFVLYDSPPKRIFTDRDATLHSLGLCPMGKIFFTWANESAQPRSQYVLDVQKLRDMIRS